MFQLNYALCDQKAINSTWALAKGNMFRQGEDNHRILGATPSATQAARQRHNLLPHDPMNVWFVSGKEWG